MVVAILVTKETRGCSDKLPGLERFFGVVVVVLKAGQENDAVSVLWAAGCGWRGDEKGQANDQGRLIAPMEFWFLVITPIRRCKQGRMTH